jgi:hypothetical protein
VGQSGHCKSRGLSFCNVKGKNHKWGTDSLYNTEQYQQLKQYSLLVTGCHISSETSLV